MMNEEAKTVAVQATDAQALATIEAARIGAEAQTNAALEAARIAAEAGHAQVDAAHFVGWLTAGSTLVAGVIAAVVAGIVAHKIGSRQMAIQERLAHIEATKVRLDLVERRAAFIDAVDGAFGMLVATRGMFGNNGKYPEGWAEDLQDYRRLIQDRHRVVQFLFDDTAEAVWSKVENACDHISMLTLRLEAHPLDEVGREVLDLALGYTLDLRQKAEEILVPQMKPDLEALTSIEVGKAQKSLTERLRGFFGRDLSRNKQKASQ